MDRDEGRGRSGGRRRHPNAGRRIPDRWRRALARRFGIDPRALAAFRVALGALLILDLALRSRHLVAFYTDRGVLPRAALAELAPWYGPSLHAATGGPWLQAGLFVLAGLVACCLIAGYRTRVATLSSLVLLVSLHLRNPLVLNGGDLLLRRLVFWSLFLPLGARWSVDAVRTGSRTDRVTTLASAALLVQVVLVYLVNLALKLRGESWPAGTGTRYVFALDRFLTPPGTALAEFPRVLAAIDGLWLATLAASVLLVASAGRLRVGVVLALAGAHLGMALTMRIGVFPLVSLAALIPFLPPRVWDLAGRFADRRPRSSPGGAGRRDPGTVAARGRSAVERLAALDGALPSVAVPPGVERWGARLATVVVAASLVTVLLWNGAALGYLDPPDPVGGAVEEVGPRWNMFAPEPPRVDGWYVAPARLESGGRVDAIDGGPVRFDPPPDVGASYPSARWRKYLDNVHGEYAHLRPALAAYLCRRVADRGDDPLRVTVYRVERPTRLDGPEPTRRVELVERSCGPVG